MERKVGRALWATRWWWSCPLTTNSLPPLGRISVCGILSDRWEPGILQKRIFLSGLEVPTMERIRKLSSRNQSWPPKRPSSQDQSHSCQRRAENLSPALFFSLRIKDERLRILSLPPSPK